MSNDDIAGYLQMLDVLIRKGRIVDGTGNPWFNGDVGIRNGIIEKVGHVNAEAGEIINATGLFVCPGFIDSHAHSDFSILANPLAESKIRQGVTTEVIGNCGLSAAPIKRERLDLLKKYVEALTKEIKLDWDWSSVGDYLRRIESGGSSINIVPLVGHGTTRIAVMGFENRVPFSDELEEMKGLVAQACNDGVRGLSSGLMYPPGCFADKTELIELLRVVAKYGGIYTSHIRDQSERLIEAVQEAIEIGNEAGVPVHISHHQAAGMESWGKVRNSLGVVDKARDGGIDITVDVYPYTAGSTFLSIAIPRWAHEGGVDELIRRIRDPETRFRLRTEIENDPSCGLGRAWDPENMMINYCKKNKVLEGKTLAEIARSKGKDWIDTMLDLLVEEEHAVGMVVFLMWEEDVCAIMKHPAAMIGSDSSAVAPYGVLGAGKPHPRAYGAYPRVLREYVMNKKVMTLEEAIKKMTSQPAQRFGLCKRGLIKEGAFADITIFDLDKVKDKAMYAEPHQYAEGIEYVLVNGVIVIASGEHTRAVPGRILRREVS